MCTTDRLLVRVNDELVLDAGTCEEASGSTGPERRIRPPETTLFRQVLAYLRAKPDPPSLRSRTTAGQEGVAAAALTLRWGSYLAVLLDRNKPLWSAVDSQGISRIGDEEIARINIEASAALAEWIDLFRADPGGPLYMQIVGRALFYLPVSPRTVKLELSEFGALAVPEIAARLIEGTDSARLERTRADVEQYPSRILANALVNTAWRNGPVEETSTPGTRRGAPSGSGA